MSNTIIDGLRERISSAMTVNQSVGIMLPGNNYSDLTQALFEFIYSKPKTAWVYVTITNPYGNIVKKFGNMLDKGNIQIRQHPESDIFACARDGEEIFIAPIYEGIKDQEFVAIVSQ